MDDIEVLTEQNRRFIEACRQGSWSMLQPVLTPSFGYLHGASGEEWDMDRYIKALEENPAPALTIDQVVIRVDGDLAFVSARTHRDSGSARYLDTYQRVDGSWLCVHACVWPVAS